MYVSSSACLLVWRYVLKADKVCLFTKIIKQKKTKNHTHETYYIGDFFFSFLLTHGVQVTKGLIGPFHSWQCCYLSDAQYQTIPNKSHLNQSVKSKTLLFFTMKPIQICPLLSKSQIVERNATPNAVKLHPSMTRFRT